MAVFEELNFERPNNHFETSLKKQMLAYSDTFKQSEAILKLNNGVPCVIITAGKRWRETEVLNDRWRASHQKMASDCGTQLIVAEDKGHMLPYHAESIVIDEIVKMARH